MSECNRIIIDLGTSGHVNLTIRWTDDNCLSYEETIQIAARGEKPKSLWIERLTSVLFIRIGQLGEEI